MSVIAWPTERARGTVSLELLEPISTERLLVRPFVAGDVDALAAIYADDETMRRVGGCRTRRQVCDELAHVVAGYELHGFGPRAVVADVDGRLIGRCGIEIRRLDGESRFEVSYLLARQAWKMGYATEAATAVRDAAFTAGIAQIIAIIEPDNVPSARVAERLGMRLSHDTVWNGRAVSIYVVDQEGGV